MSHSISAMAGKARDPMLAKAGAIAEAIEVAMFEAPEPYETKVVYSKVRLENFGFALTSDAKEPFYELKQEPVLHYASGTELSFPSDLIWLDYRENSPFIRSSNGQALGANAADAILQGLYECIERDAMTIWDMIYRDQGTLPPLVNLSDAPESVIELVDKVNRAGLRVFVMRATYDIPLPIYCAFLVDPSEAHVQAYGYGTSIFDVVAIERAILEAIQGRCVYIAGARDDITRTRYKYAKHCGQRELIARLDLIQPKMSVDWTSYDITTEEELGWAVQDIGPWAGKMFVKVLTKDFVAAKVIIPGLEAPIMDGWTSVGRYEQVKHERQNVNIFGSHVLRA
jgi:YcaO-like protein with predicted kinase domain